MRKVLLDTNFILSCFRKKIDFFEDLKFNGLKILIPDQVILELERIVNSKKKLRFREEAELALKFLKQNDFEKVDLKNKYVDEGILKIAKDNKNLIIATLDKDLKKKLRNNKMVIRGRVLEIV